MEQNTITQERLVAREKKALEKVKRANAELAKVRGEQKEQLRTEHNHHNWRSQPHQCEDIR